MANIRRHFNFNGKPFLSQDPFMKSQCKSNFTNFDKLALMNNICNCLDLCCSYVQALNNLCSAGTSLARNLFYTVREVPSYQNISLQFFSVWEEISKATAGASAAVKTETLMLLQELLNSLETSSNEVAVNNIIMDSFQAIGSCLSSFIELQAQFSWSTWKSLSKLSKHFTSEPFKSSLNLQLKSFEKKPIKLIINADLNSMIRKHFSQSCGTIGIPKVNEFPQNLERQFDSSSVSNKRNLSTCQFTPGKVQHDVPSESLCSSTSYTSKHSGIPEQTDLEVVINLLSCVPIQQFSDKLRNRSITSYEANDEQLNNIIPKATLPSFSGQLQRCQIWEKPPENLENNPLYWTVNECPSLSINSDVARKQHTYENHEFYKHWKCCSIHMNNTPSSDMGTSSDNASSHCFHSEFFPSDKTELVNSTILNTAFKQGCSSYGESKPGGLENISEYEEHPLEVQPKINTQ